VIEIHRPYFDPEEFSRLDVREARTRYQELMAKARAFLTKVSVQSSIIEKMFSIDSQNTTYLSEEEIESLRMSPELSELELAKCGPEVRLEDQSEAPDGCVGKICRELTPQHRRYLRKYGDRLICWAEAQKQLRQSVIDDFLQRSAAESPPP
jgi:hypothetical protein